MDPLDESTFEASFSGNTARSMCSQSATEVLKECSLKSLLDTGILSDFEIIVDGHVFHVHKVILAARSGYFSGLLKPGSKEYQESRVCPILLCLKYMF